MSGRVGSITTDIAAKGLVFNLDAANRASFLPVVSNTQGFNTVNPSQTITSATSDIFNTSNNVKNFSFGGVDDYMTLSSGLTVSSFTVDLWLKTNHVNDEGSQNAYVDNLTGGTGFFKFFSFGQLGSNNMRLSNYHGAPISDFALSTDELNDNLWHNCIITFENGTLKSYIDGLLDKTVTGLSSWSTSTLNTIGRYYQADIRYYTGTLASFRIYNQVLPVKERKKNFDGLKRRVGYVAPLTVSFLVVGGGGASAGSATAVGGAGAGGLRTSFGSTSGGNSSAEDDLKLLPGTSYTVTVGAGASGTTSINAGPRGNDSVFATITSKGGGNGGSGNVDNAGTRETSYPPSDRTKGSGGGAGRNWGTAASIGIGTTGQGMDGNYSRYDGTYTGGGGGGASQDGYRGNHGTYPGGGGDGLAVAITGTSVTYAGGGGGSKWNVGSSAAPGGAGGGGNGGVRNGAAPTDAGANTGGGGGGPRGGASSPDNSSSNGGSGVVILRYPSSNSITVGAGLTSSTSTDGAFKVTTFTAGTDTISFS